MWLTATIENPVGSGDQLAADVPSDSGLNSNFANNVLTISGTSEQAAEYQSALQSITYSTSSLALRHGPSDDSHRGQRRLDGKRGVRDEHCRLARQSSGANGDDAAGRRVGQLGRHGQLHRRGQRRPVPTVQWEVSTNGGSTFSAISGADLYHLQLYRDSRGHRKRVRGRLHQQLRHGHHVARAAEG